jgi:hypothetical protein
MEAGEPSRPTARYADHYAVHHDATVFRSPRQAKAVRFACLIGGPVLLAAYAIAPIGAAWMRIAAVLVALALPVVYMARLRHAGVSIADGVVHVVNVTHTVEVPVGDVDRFDVGPGRFFPRIGRLKSRDGRCIHIWAIQSTLNQHVRESDRGAHDVVDALNHALGVDARNAA